MYFPEKIWKILLLVKQSLAFQFEFCHCQNKLKYVKKDHRYLFFSQEIISWPIRSDMYWTYCPEDN